MNLCFINPGIIPKYEIFELAKYLPKNYSITILQSFNISRGFYLSENIYVRYVPSIFIHLRGSIVTIPFFQKWIEALLDLIRNDKCDLLHVCDYGYLTSIPPILVRRKFDYIPTLIVNDALVGVESYSFGSSLLDVLSRMYTHFLGTRILRSYDKIVFLHSQLAEESKTLGLPKQKIAVIPNGIDAKKIFDYQANLDVERVRMKYGIEENEKVILFVGRLVKGKRVEIVFEVVKKLINQGLKVKALIVGPQRTELDKMAYPIRHNVIFTGYLSEEKYECYHIADLFLLPSLSEGLPTVLLEAASSGIPMVATNTNGIPDIVIHGKTGFLADKWDINSYLKYSKLLLTDKSLAHEMGRNARKYVEEKFSWDKIIREYENIYNELIN